MRCPFSQLSSMKRNDGALIGDGVIDEVLLGPRRDHQQGEPRAVAAAALRMSGAGATPGSAALARSAGARAGERVGGWCGLIHDRPHLVVVPAVGIVIGDHHGGRCPVAGCCCRKLITCDDELLLVERIGVAGMAVLISREPSGS